ncbi:MAG: DUF4396 domain-containing protein [Geobacteraceae bacterium]|nr:MAG: DUF4396 domain-containing protein [Geobacteraceae bacterium]
MGVTHICLQTMKPPFIPAIDNVNPQMRIVRARSLLPLFRAGIGVGPALKLALAADTLSITIMEIVDNAVMLIIPGAMGAGLTEPQFWGSLIFALVVAGVIAFPANRWLIARGRGHALVHKHHNQHPSNKVIAEEGHEYKQHIPHH